MELGSLFQYIIKEWGLWAGLSMFLIWSSNKRNDDRESKYQQTIEQYRDMLIDNQDIIHKLANSFEEMKELRDDVKEIKNSLHTIRCEK